MLANSGRLDSDVATAIANAYRALRTAEHRIQMIDDRQEHRLPADPTALEAIARLNGSDGSEAFLAMLAPHVEAVGQHFDGLVSEREERLSNDPDILRAELAAMGFAEVDEAYRRVFEWRSGRARSLRSPRGGYSWRAADPDAGGGCPIRSAPPIVSATSSTTVERSEPYRLPGARPKLADLLALILAHAEPLAEQLGRRPTLLDGLIDDPASRRPMRRPCPSACWSWPRASCSTLRSIACAGWLASDGSRWACNCWLPPRPDHHRRGLQRPAEATIVALPDWSIRSLGPHQGRSPVN
jgi:glutamate-ammonia-ligase adenylyltransferase